MLRTWRLIESGPCSAAWNMALDEALALGASAEPGSAPVLRLYGWEVSSLSLGRFQKTAGLDLDYCLDKGIAVVRRPTGGRAILHGDEFTYSVAAPTEGPFSGGLRETYRRISRALGRAVASLGIELDREERAESRYDRSPLCFRWRTYGELASGGLKLAGSAQRRLSGGFLQHGSIPYAINREETLRIFGYESGERLLEGAAGLRELLNRNGGGAVPLEKDFRLAVIEAFSAEFGVRLEPGEPSGEELEAADRLVEEKYLDSRWTLHRPPPERSEADRSSTSP